MSSLPRLAASSTGLAQRGQTGMKHEGLPTVQPAHRRDRQRSNPWADPNDAGAVLKVEGDRLGRSAKLYPTADDLTPTPAIQPVISETSDNSL